MFLYFSINFVRSKTYIQNIFEYSTLSFLIEFKYFVLYIYIYIYIYIKFNTPKKYNTIYVLLVKITKCLNLIGKSNVMYLILQFCV